MTSEQSISRLLADAQEIVAWERKLKHEFYTERAADFGVTVQSAIRLSVSPDYAGNKESMTGYAYRTARTAAHFGALALALRHRFDTSVSGS